MEVPDLGILHSRPRSVGSLPCSRAKRNGVKIWVSKATQVKAYMYHWSCMFLELCSQARRCESSLSNLRSFHFVQDGAHRRWLV
jgi:hypothetical protein